MARPKKKYEGDTAKRGGDICTALAGGASRKDAAGAGGVSYDTLLDWIRVFPVFAMQVEAAESVVAIEMSNAIVKAGREGDWRAAETWLKRRRPDEWSEKNNSPLDAQIEYMIAKLVEAEKKEGTE